MTYQGLVVNFAENRSSDDIAIYPFDWNNGNEEEKEKLYREKAKYIKCESFFEAFHFILKHFDIKL